MYKIDSQFPEFSLPAYFPLENEVGIATSQDFIGRFLIVMFYPADFTFVCPTELADLHKRYEEIQSLNGEVLAVSTDTVFTHKVWLETERLLQGVRYSMAADHTGAFTKQLGIYDESTGMAQRATFIIDPEGILRSVDITTDNLGRSAGETIRRLKALSFVRSNPGLACPASWDESKTSLKPSIHISGKVYEEITVE